MHFQLCLIDILIYIHLIISIFDIDISSGWLLRVKTTAHLLCKSFLVGLHSSFICTPSALIICLHFLADLLIVSLIILQMLFNYVTISVVNFILCRNGIVQIYWFLYFQIYKVRIINCLNASFFQIFLTSFNRNNAFWTYHVVLHLKHTAFS